MTRASDQIRTAIATRQMTQKEMAQRLGISETYLSDILTGRRSLSAFVAVRLERVLGMDASQLMYAQAFDELEKARREYQ